MATTAQRAPAARQYHLAGRPAWVVRPATPADAEGVLQLQREVMEEGSEYFVRTPTEFDSEWALAGQQLRDLLDQDNSLWIVAERDGEVLGSLDFHGGRYHRIRHVGHFGMSVRAEFRHQGVGSALVEVLLDWARLNPAIQKVSTTLFTTNARAMTLLTRHGFVGQGVRQREYQISPGRFLDAVTLARWVLA